MNCCGWVWLLLDSQVGSQCAICVFAAHNSWLQWLLVPWSLSSLPAKLDCSGPPRPRFFPIPSVQSSFRPGTTAVKVAFCASTSHGARANNAPGVPQMVPQTVPQRCSLCQANSSKVIRCSA
ncbi:hypothetical protein EDB81DRAFT_771403 [Dactylonectria macrodidyma]|uniref:Uncharacterized protein n=1 Tax=Dactylonectria macrodidyma TaxID=307937 RepID=A0A9P9FTG6_9HYPO|nr:hypothetical protein EDB81DRAFT_771403 [Dactylonectria macrodidyma]